MQNGCFCLTPTKKPFITFCRRQLRCQDDKVENIRQLWADYSLQLTATLFPCPLSHLFSTLLSLCRSQCTNTRTLSHPHFILHTLFLTKSHTQTYSLLSQSVFHFPRVGVQHRGNIRASHPHPHHCFTLRCNMKNWKQQFLEKIFVQSWGGRNRSRHNSWKAETTLTPIRPRVTTTGTKTRLLLQEKKVEKLKNWLNANHNFFFFHLTSLISKIKWIMFQTKSLKVLNTVK